MSECVYVNEAFLLYSKKLPISQACISTVSQSLTLLLDLLRKLACLFLLLFSDWLLHHYEKNVILIQAESCTCVVWRQEKYFSFYKKKNETTQRQHFAGCIYPQCSWCITWLVSASCVMSSLRRKRFGAFVRKVETRAKKKEWQGRSKKPRNKNYAPRAEAFFCCF